MFPPEAGLTKESGGRRSGFLEGSAVNHSLCESQSGDACCSRAPPPVMGLVGGPLLRCCSAATFVDAWQQLVAASRGGGGGGIGWRLGPKAGDGGTVRGSGGGLRVGEPSLVSGAPMGAAPRSERGRMPTSTPVPAPLRYGVKGAGESALERADSGVSV